MPQNYIVCLVFLFLLLGSATAQQGSEISIVFFSPAEGTVFGKGDTVNIEFSVNFPAGSKDLQVEAFVETGSGSEKRISLENNSEGNYSFELKTNYEMRNEVRFRVNASAAGIPGPGSNELYISLEPAQISMDFSLFPTEPYSVGSRIEKVMIDAFYPDGSRVPLKNWQNTPSLEINGKRKRLDLKEEPDGSLSADLNFTVEANEEFFRKGNGGLQITLMDMVDDRFGNFAGNPRKEFEIAGIEELFPNLNGPNINGPDMNNGIDPPLLLGAIVAVFAFFTFIVWLLVLRKKKEETTAQLKEEAEVLKELLKKIEIDYYKRRLSESEYKSRALDYQARLNRILAKLKVKETKQSEKQPQEEEN